MASENASVDIATAPDLQQLAETVRQSGKPIALTQDGETVAVLRPAPKRAAPTSAARRTSRRSGVFTMDDPLWSIVGMIDDPDGPTDVSSNKHAYLAGAYMDEHP